MQPQSPPKDRAADKRRARETSRLKLVNDEVPQISGDGPTQAVGDNCSPHPRGYTRNVAGAHIDRPRTAFRNHRLLPGPDGTADPTRKPLAWLQAKPSQHSATPVQDQPVSFDALQPEHTTRWEIRSRVTISPNALDWEDPIP